MTGVQTCALPICWAKTGKPIVKEFEDDYFTRHALVLDTFTDDPRSVVFEEAVSVAASFACTIQTQESLLDLLFVGPQAYCFTSGRGLANADQMLEILASVRAIPDQPFSSLEQLVLEHAASVIGAAQSLATALQQVNRVHQSDVRQFQIGRAHV